MFRMADVIYPDYLPDFLMGKSRKERQTYATTEPLKGAYYTEKITDDTPVIWECEIKCHGVNQSRFFQQFLESVKGGRTFIKSILTEYGHVPHEVSFVVEPREPRQIGINVWSYPCTIRASKLVIPKSFIFHNMWNY